MDPIKYEYSVKNIPISSKNQYLFALIKKTEAFIKRIRWAALFFLLTLRKDVNPASDNDKNKFQYMLKTNRCPPPIEETKEFEIDLWRIVENIIFRIIQDSFQSKLAKDVQKIVKSNELIIGGDKTSNFYKVPKPQHDQIISNNVTKDYKKCDSSVTNEINNEAKAIATKLNIEKRINSLTEQQCFITIKDHKEDFRTNPKYRLINPAKPELGRISKKILERINAKLRQTTKINQWQSTKAAIEWFKSIPQKQECTFIIFDIAEFYPSITKQLLLDSINHAKLYTDITDDDINVIMHSRKSLLFNKNQPWIKKHGEEMFDVTMGSHDGAEACELIGAYLLAQLQAVVPKEDIGLYRDDGLGILRNTSGPQGERIRKQIISIFKQNNLKIEIKLSKTADFLDVSFDLNKNVYRTYQKPNNEPSYVHKLSNHPPQILKQIPNSIAKRISDNSSSKEIFDESAEYYNRILEKSGYKEKIQYWESNKQTKKKRQREIIWYNPPFCKSVKTKIGHQFINLIDKHFGNKENVLHKIFEYV